MSDRAGDEKVSIRMISDPNSIRHMERVWNTLVNRSCENPFLLNGFVERFMESNRSKGWAPLVLVVSEGQIIIGIAPLIIKKKFGVRSVKFIHTSCFSPDFIFHNQYRKTCIAHTFDLLFKTLKCKFADFPLPAESPNLPFLKKQCKANRVHFLIKPEMGHNILPIGFTWTEFEASKGRNFRRKFKKIEKKLDREGSWKVVRVDGNRETDVIRKILAVERMSWKEAWRVQRGEKIDEDLLMILKASQHTARTEPAFKWGVWFLELNDQPLAYSLVIQYKQVAFSTKTSYDERYKKFYPSIYLLNSVIRELINKRQVKSVDFLTDLSFHQTWTLTTLPRVRAMLAKGVLPTIVRSAYANEYLMKSRRMLFDPLLSHFAI